MRLAPVILALLLAGCLEPEGGRPRAATASEAALDHVQAFVDEDVERVLSYYADDWVDLGGGDGTPFTTEERREKLVEFYASERWRGAEVRSPDALLDFANATYRAHGDYRSETESWRGRFEPTEADVEVAIPPREGSPLFDGWFGFYRPEGAGWVQVAGD